MNKIYKIKGFIPFIIAAFINSFIDLGHKVIMMNIIYKSFNDETQFWYSLIINALIILPFILAFSPSGFLSDRFPKSEILKVAAGANVLLFFLLFLSYVNGFFWVAFYTTFLLALQSAFYSTAKYGYIKELVGKKNLTWGNGIIQASTVIAMLFSLIIFSALFEQLYDLKLATPNEILRVMFPLSILLCVFGILELIISFRLPLIPPTSKIIFNKSHYISGELLRQNLYSIAKHKIVFLSVIFITIFWSISQLIVDIFPVYVKNNLHISNTRFVVSILAITGLGIIVGSVIAGRFSKNYIETGFIPLGACIIFIAITLFTLFDSFFMLAVLFFLFGLGGALYIVPLNALMQFYTDNGELGRVIAGSNFIQSMGMICSLVVANSFAILAWNESWLFYVASIISCITMIYTIKLMPFSLVRILISIAILQRYRLIVEGFNNIPRTGGVLLLGNHISFIDWAIVQMALPKKVYFVMERSIYSRWYVRLFIDFFGVIPVSNLASKESIGQIQKHISNGDMVCLFPEGVISRHGHLNEFKSGFEKISQGIDESRAVILPFYIRGMWGSIFSRSNEQFRERKRSFTKRDVSIAFGESIPLHTHKDKIKAKIFEMSFKAWEHQCKNSSTLAEAFIESCKRGGNDIAIVDTQTGSISYRRLLALCVILSQDIKEMNFKPLPKKTSNCSLPNDCIGVLLPSSIASVICNFATIMSGKIVVNLNFTAGKSAISSAIKSANISHIYTSKKFLDKLKERGVEFDFSDCVVHFMEDIVMGIRKHKIVFILNLILISLMPTWLLKLLFAKDSDIDSVCAILFSSGSEGAPKGVMLTNLNIMSNIAQIADVIHARNDETILSSLPPFHAFGLTVTTFMPLIENILAVAHADPTDALGVAKAIAQNKVTVMCATSTLLGIYARNSKLDKVMFDSIRLTVSGAEKLKSEVREAYTIKFNKPIYEGYGATETTPVASVNLPDEFDVTYWQIHRANKEGSVGMPLPGTAIRIVDCDTLEQLPTGEQGLILIGGHQIMQGYLNDPEKTSEVILELEGIRWYKSGDKGYVDSDGFLHITDRYSRFAKIGGEMISLSSIEEEIAKILKLNDITQEVRFCAVGLDDLKKGEKIVLLIESSGNIHEHIISSIKDSNMIPLRKPSQYFIVDMIPMLGSGKVDLKGVKDLAIQVERDMNAKL
ncbi:MFS transporter [Helicobacter muridarum]|uniref:2-acyl-glycerophospho-ethanolamine acyltransferase n=1 Tax=Helicobacter muridarum TaxID=216 RepID=A0A377PV81_9HELI|nr:acyl-[ACP]--phospholipid O-acyltransferase [Helicobacter muridarum]TLD98159.1 MFS transporter [Helicobacter muridarum]STQ86487.1 2-acyl-glycerophospho-ethanolamine acyltransferase [Helicobacter muridarum]